MASTNKTGLGFNQWLMSDKPTMEDFNADNALANQLLEKTLSKSDGGTVTGLTDFTGGLRLAGNPVADIETGRWQPTCDSIHFTVSWANYTRVGGIVFGNCLINITSILDSSGYLALHGLPFPAQMVGNGTISRTTAITDLSGVTLRLVGECIYVLKNNLAYNTAECKIGNLELAFCYMV